MFVFIFTHNRKSLLDKATDPDKSKEGVDYMTPVCDKINLDLDGWDNSSSTFCDIVQALNVS